MQTGEWVLSICSQWFKEKKFLLILQISASLGLLFNPSLLYLWYAYKLWISVSICDLSPGTKVFHVFASIMSNSSCLHFKIRNIGDRTVDGNGLCAKVLFLRTRLKLRSCELNESRPWKLVNERCSSYVLIFLFLNWLHLEWYIISLKYSWKNFLKSFCYLNLVMWI